MSIGEDFSVFESTIIPPQKCGAGYPKSLPAGRQALAAARGLLPPSRLGGKLGLR